MTALIYYECNVYIVYVVCFELVLVYMVNLNLQANLFIQFN